MKTSFRKNLINASISGVLVLTSVPAFAVEKGDWLARFGVANISPNDSSTSLTAAGANSTVGVDGDTQVFAPTDHVERYASFTEIVFGCELFKDRSRVSISSDLLRKSGNIKSQNKSST